MIKRNNNNNNNNKSKKKQLEKREKKILNHTDMFSFIHRNKLSFFFKNYHTQENNLSGIHAHYKFYHELGLLLPPPLPPFPSLIFFSFTSPFFFFVILLLQI